MCSLFQLCTWIVISSLFPFCGALAGEPLKKPTLITLEDGPISGLIEFPSRAVGQTFFIPYSTPQDLDQLRAESPKIVVYFLHGFMLDEGADYFDPLSRSRMEDQGNAVTGMIGSQYITNSKELAAALDIVIIHVNGGSCVYRNAIDPEEPQFETHIIEELMPYVEATFGTIANRQGRGLVGLSMGALGAAYYGLKYEGLFGAVSCRGGKYGLADRGAAQKADFPQLLEDWGYHWPRVFGEAIDYATYAQQAPILMVDNLKGIRPALRIDNGANDYPDLRKSTRQFHQKLLTLDIPHLYRETPDGHTWAPHILQGIVWATHTLRDQTSLEGLKRQNP